MANIFTLKSGLASDVTVWSGGAVPVGGDRVLVKAGHTVELDGAHEWGDDVNNTTVVLIDGYSTTRAITIAGTLKHSRTVSSSLLCRGYLHLRDTGVHDVGTAADPILLPTTATISLNHSLAMAASKYGYEGALLCKFSAYGSPKVLTAKLTEATTVGANSIKVTQAEGWQPGDSLVLSQTDITGPRRQDTAVIAPSYVPGSLNVPLVGTLLYTHSLVCVVGNLTSNVTVKTSNSGFEAGAFHLQGGQFSTPASRNMRYVAFEDLGGVYPASGVALRYAANYSATNWPQPYGELRDLVIVRRLAKGTIVQTENCSAVTPVEFVDCVFAHVHPTEADSANHVVASHTRFTRCYHFGVSPSFGGVTDVVYIDCHLLARGRDFLSTGKGLSALVSGLKMGGWCQNSGAVTHFNAQASCNDLVLVDCDFGVTYPLMANVPLFFMQSLDARITTTAKDCVFGPTVTEPSLSSMNCLSSESYVRIVNKNKDATSQQEYRREGVYRRDNTERFRGTSSLSMRPNAVDRSCKRSRLVPCANGSTVRLLGYVKMDAAYLNGGNCTPPTVTLSGLGVTPQVFTMALNTDWQQFDLSATNASGFDGELSLALEATPLSVATGTVYIDGIPDAPFVTKVRHYGFTFEEGSPLRTVNPVVQVTEAIAAAYTGVTINPATPKITVGAGTANTWRKLYDHYQAWACNNIASDVLLTSVDGVNFTLPLTCKLEWMSMPADGTLSGGWLQLAAPGFHSYSLSGTKIDFTVAGTYSMGGTEFSGSIELVNSSGGPVVVQVGAGVSYTNTGPNITVELPSSDVLISAPALIAGSRVQLYSVTGAAQMYNEAIGAGGLSFTLPYTTDIVVRLRADHNTKLPLETLGVLTSAGLTFLDVQEEDDIYISNAIDGSTITEFLPDGANIQVDINDLDGVTEVQRLYAWLQWYMQTEAGVASPFFGCITAIDAVNYKIDVTKANMLLDNIGGNDIHIKGAYMYRSDGTTLIAPGSKSIYLDAGKAYGIEVGTSGLTPSESLILSSLAKELSLQTMQADVALLLTKVAPTTAAITTAVWADAKANLLAKEATVVEVGVKVDAVLAKPDPATATPTQIATAVWADPTASTAKETTVQAVSDKADAILAKPEPTIPTAAAISTTVWAATEASALAKEATLLATDAKLTALAAKPDLSVPTAVEIKTAVWADAKADLLAKEATLAAVGSDVDTILAKPDPVAVVVPTADEIKVAVWADPTVATLARQVTVLTLGVELAETEAKVDVLVARPVGGATAAEIRTELAPELAKIATKEEISNTVWAHAFAKTLLTVGKFLGLK